MSGELKISEPYEAPLLTVIGTFEEITQATSTGTHLDATMPAGTPISVVLDHLS